jgi:hypothetical protein
MIINEDISCTSISCTSAQKDRNHSFLEYCEANSEHLESYADRKWSGIGPSCLASL